MVSLNKKTTIALNIAILTVHWFLMASVLYLDDREVNQRKLVTYDFLGIFFFMLNVGLNICFLVSICVKPFIHPLVPADGFFSLIYLFQFYSILSFIAGVGSSLGYIDLRVFVPFKTVEAVAKDYGLSEPVHSPLPLLLCVVFLCFARELKLGKLYLTQCGNVENINDYSKTNSAKERLIDC